MLPSMPKQLVQNMSPKQWIDLPREIQTILALSWFVLFASMGLALILWVIRHAA